MKNIYGQEIPQMAARNVESQEFPRGSQVKPIDVDDEQYLPGVGIVDWAEEYYEMGGEG
jgi:hypothetical protein